MTRACERAGASSAVTRTRISASASREGMTSSLGIHVHRHKNEMRELRWLFSLCNSLMLSNNADVHDTCVDEKNGAVNIADEAVVKEDDCSSAAVICGDGQIGKNAETIDLSGTEALDDVKVAGDILKSVIAD